MTLRVRDTAYGAERRRANAAKGLASSEEEPTSHHSRNGRAHRASPNDRLDLDLELLHPARLVLDDDHAVDDPVEVQPDTEGLEDSGEGGGRLDGQPE